MALPQLTEEQRAAALEKAAAARRDGYTVTRRPTRDATVTITRVGRDG